MEDELRKQKEEIKEKEERGRGPERVRGREMRDCKPTLLNSKIYFLR